MLCRHIECVAVLSLIIWAEYTAHLLNDGCATIDDHAAQARLVGKLARLVVNLAGQLAGGCQHQRRGEGLHTIFRSQHMHVNLLTQALSATGNMDTWTGGSLKSLREPCGSGRKAAGLSAGCWR